jgi:hypothetical protein
LVGLVVSSSQVLPAVVRYHPVDVVDHFRRMLLGVEIPGHAMDEQAPLIHHHLQIAIVFGPSRCVTHLHSAPGGAN